MQNMRDNSLIIFVVVGRLGKRLTESKLVPIVNSENVKKVYIFREEIGFYIKGAKYIILPKFIRKIKNSFVKKIFRIICEPLQLLYYAMKLKPDYINGVYTLPKGLNSLIISRLIKVKSIVSVIGGVNEITKKESFRFHKLTIFFKKLNLWILRNCDFITTKGIMVKNYLIRQGIYNNKIFVFNGSINTYYFKPPSDNKRDIDILFVGTFIKLKGPDRVLKVIFNLKTRFPNINAYFLGDGHLFGLINKEAQRFELKKNVFLTGNVNETVAYYQRSKILLMPSSTEGLSTAMLEAMACGCVPIVSNVGNMTDAAWHNINAMVVDDYMDIDTFTKYSNELLSNEKKRKNMAEEGIKIVQEKYSIEAQAKVFERILRFGEQL